MGDEKCNSIISSSVLTYSKIYSEEEYNKLKKENDELKQKLIIQQAKVEKLEKQKFELPTHYIINDSACILFFGEKDKVVVRRCADDEFNPRLAFLTALFQHYCGMSKNKANKYLANLQVEVKKEDSEEKPKHLKEETKQIKDRDFKIGDRVEVIEDDVFSEKGWKGKITEIDNSNNLILVKYDNGEKWNVLKKQIKLVKEEK